MTDTLTPPGTLPKRKITVHFDGSCLLIAGAPSGTLHPGGYAAIVVNDLTNKRKELHGPVPETTNNRAELTAAIEALEFILPGAVVTMVGDSQYVINGMTRWRFDWARNRWRGSDNKPIKNLDLWQKLFELAKKPARIEWVWAKGHAGNELNERADYLANAEAKKLKRLMARR